MVDVTNSERATTPRAELDAILASTHDAIIGSSRLGMIDSWNPAAGKLLAMRRSSFGEVVVGR